MSKQILVIAAPNLVLLGSQVPGNQPGKRASWLRVPPGKRKNMAGNGRKQPEKVRYGKIKMGMPELVVHDPDRRAVLGMRSPISSPKF